ncbi:hypothetical protein WJX72_009914 [[Myrmecia] bisecta]|uniref:Histone deacetylase complex subunit SAP30 Sin3 binding domain-containing protein n=1 Tax=[Myrmecia] bisecta TaxID=41462 RepID=A0AAW1PV49_9CHLO
MAMDAINLHSASTSDEDAGSQDEEDAAALLPKHTKVLVTGNNRTRRQLIGVKGVVKKATGLGGWHWLVLDTGESVRLQRNALSVLEAPQGNESEFSDSDNEAANNNNSDLLPRVRARRPPRPVAHSPDLPQQRRSSTRQTITQPRINFNRLDTAALKRYRRFYKLGDIAPNCTKDQLVSAVGRHFMSQTVDENKVIAMFVQAARRRQGQPSD